VRAGLALIPEAAGHEIVRKAHVKYLDLGAAGEAGSIASSRKPTRNLAQPRHSTVDRVGFRKRLRPPFSF
jgi:hypothetical protein